MKTSKAILLIICCQLTACGPSSQRDFRQEGQAISRELIRELDQIQGRDELLAAQDRLERLYQAIVDCMIEAQELAEEQGLAPLPQSPEDRALSDRLRESLARVYEMDGGREIVESAQREALIRLDRHSKKN